MPGIARAEQRTVQHRKVPAEHLVEPLAVIDISERAATDPDAVVLPDDILRWERNHDRLPAGSFLAMYSGWEERLPTDKFLNADGDGVFHVPGWSLEAAEFLGSGGPARVLAVG